MQAMNFLESLEKIAVINLLLPCPYVMRIVKQRLDMLVAAVDFTPNVNPASDVSPAPDVLTETLMFLESLEAIAKIGRPLQFPYTLRLIKQQLDKLLPAYDSASNVSPAPPAPNVISARSSDSDVEDVGTSSKENGVSVVFLSIHSSAVPCSILLVL